MRLSYKEESYLVAKELVAKLSKAHFIDDSIEGRIFILSSIIDTFLDECLLRKIRILCIEGAASNKGICEITPSCEFTLYGVKGRNWPDLIDNIIKKIRTEFVNGKKFECDYLYFTLQKRGDGYSCPCCGFLTRSEYAYGTYEICPVCGWEDDSAQAVDPNFPGGANKESLNEAQANYKKYGVSAQRYIGQVRKPNEDEVPDDLEID